MLMWYSGIASALELRYIYGASTAQVRRRYGGNTVQRREKGGGNVKICMPRNGTGMKEIVIKRPTAILQKWRDSFAESRHLLKRSTVLFNVIRKLGEDNLALFAVSAIMATVMFN